MVRLILVLGAALALSACAGPGGRGGGASAPGAGCTATCNRNYAVCSDSSAASRTLGPFSGAEACKTEMRQCLASCRAQQ